MMENDRSLIERMIQSFGQEPQVERVMLLDREGQRATRARRSGPAADLTLELADLPGLPPLPARAADRRAGSSRRARRRSCGP